MEGYRYVGDDGDYCGVYECMFCKERLAVRSSMDQWACCPVCGNKWHRVETRPHNIPRWVWDRYGEHVPFNVRTYPEYKDERPDIRIEWRIEGHQYWEKDWTCRNKEMALNRWKELGCQEYRSWAIDYRMLWNGKIVLEKRVPAQEKVLGLQDAD